MAIRRVQSAGSNEALEFLNAGSPGFGSALAAAALTGNSIRTIFSSLVRNGPHR
jgi:hypothetical protein